METTSKLPPTFAPEFHNEETCKKIKYNRLGDTDIIASEMSFGASPLGNIYRKTDDAESLEVVHSALKRGVNLIDTAPWYGHGRSELTLGKILQDVPRRAYYLNTKVCRYGPTFGEMFDFSAERTIRSVDESLRRLKTDHIDIIQVHDMEFAPSLDVVINQTLPALQKMKEAGKVRYIGITGYPLENFKYVIDRSTVKIDSVLTYCHGSMNDDTLKDYIPYFKERGVAVINGSILSMGLLVNNRDPPDWHPAGQDIKRACKQAADFCQAKGVNIAKIASNFSFNFPGVDTTLIGTASMKNLDVSFDAWLNGISDVERQVADDVIDKFFKPLERKDWENVEVGKYREAIRRGRLNDTL